jgi:hypothetical protein
MNELTKMQFQLNVTWYTQTILGGALNQSRSLLTIIGLIIVLGIIVGLVWGNHQFAEKNVCGEGFFIQWTAINSMVKNGGSPFRSQVTEQLREVVGSQDGFAVGDPSRYSSPLYSGIIVLPFALIGNYMLAFALWRTAQLIAYFAILLIGLKITGWKPAWYMFLLFILINLFSYHLLAAWLDGGLFIWAALFLALAFLAIRNHRNEVGGIILALAAVQPQMTILVVAFTVLWAGSQRRRTLILWFVMTLVLLSILGSFLVSDWIVQYLRLVFNFSENFPPGTPRALFSQLWPGLGNQLGWLMTAILGVILILEVWFARGKDFRHFLWTACLVMVISQWIGIPSVPGNYSALILPLILISAMLAERGSVEGSGWQYIVIIRVYLGGLFYIDIVDLTLALN